MIVALFRDGALALPVGRRPMVKGKEMRCRHNGYFVGAADKR